MSVSGFIYIWLRNDLIYFSETSENERRSLDFFPSVHLTQFLQFLHHRSLDSSPTPCAGTALGFLCNPRQPPDTGSRVGGQHCYSQGTILEPDGRVPEGPKPGQVSRGRRKTISDFTWSRCVRIKHLWSQISCLVPTPSQHLQGPTYILQTVLPWCYLPTWIHAGSISERNKTLSPLPGLGLPGSPVFST